MAINPNVKYPTKTAVPSVGYPYGSARNITTPGDQTGTPLDQDIVNDIFGFQQSLLLRAGITPSNSPDSLITSQYIQSLFGITSRRVTTINDLRGQEPVVDREVAYVNRHTTAQVGGGMFYYDASDSTTADDDGITIVTTSGGKRWKRFVKDAVSVTWFGATGDGATDDSDAIQAAFDYVEAQGSGNLFFPPGSYRTTKEITLPVASNIKIFGAGKDLTELLFDWGGDPSVSKGLNGTYPTQQNGLTIKDITFRSPNNNDTAIYYAIFFFGLIDDVLIERCRFKNIRTSALRFSFAVTTQGDNCKIINCDFENINTPGAMPEIAGGCIYGNFNDWQIRGCTFESISAGATHHAISIEDSDKLTISDNQIKGGAYGNINLSGAEINELAFTGNVCECTGSSATQDFYNVASGIISGNSFKGATIRFNDSFLTFASNDIENTDPDIAIQDITAASTIKVLACNIVYKGATAANYGVRQTVSGSENWLVSGCNFDGVGTPIEFAGTKCRGINCYAGNTSYTGGNYVLAATADDCSFIECSIDNDSSSASVLVDNSSDAGNKFTNNHVTQGKYDFNLGFQFTNVMTASPTWWHFKIAYSDFTAAAVSDFTQLFFTPDASIIHNVFIKHDTPFSGGGASLATLEVGVASDPDKYAPAFDVFQAAGSTVYSLADIIGSEIYTGGLSFRATLRSDVNVDTLVAGDASIFVLLSRLPKTIYADAP